MTSTKSNIVSPFSKKGDVNVREVIIMEIRKYRIEFQEYLPANAYYYENKEEERFDIYGDKKEALSGVGIAFTIVGSTAAMAGITEISLTTHLISVAFTGVVFYDTYTDFQENTNVQNSDYAEITCEWIALVTAVNPITSIYSAGFSVVNTMNGLDWFYNLFNEE